VLLFSTVIIINAVTMMQLLKAAEHYGNVTSYSDLGERVFGGRGKQVVDVCILVKQIGTCVTYLYFVSTQLDFIIC
jgi:amino acid permease